MSRPTLFFSATRPLQCKRSAVDFGGSADSLYRAFVASLLDNYLNNPKLFQAQLNQLVERHCYDFKDQFSLLQQSKTKDNILHYLRTANFREKFIFQLASVAKKIAELSPLDSQGVEKEAFNRIRLANAFHCSLDVKISGKKKTLFSRMSYGSPTEEDKIRLHFQQDSAHYLAELKHAELFARIYVNSKAGILSQPKNNHAEFHQLYRQNVNSLSKKWQENTLSRRDLIDLYIKHLKVSDTLKDRKMLDALPENPNPALTDSLIYEISKAVAALDLVKRDFSLQEFSSPLKRS